MKSILTTAIFLCIMLSTYGQEKLLEILPISEGIVTYTSVIQVDGVNKEELYTRAKKWFATTYKSAKDVIQLDDKENGEIIGKGNFNISYYTRNPIINHTISISIKDGKFKYKITDFRYSDNQNETFLVEDFPKSWGGKKKLYETIDIKVKLLIDSLEKSLKSKPDTDW